MALASRSRRWRDEESPANSGGRTLMATLRSSRISRARYTSPMPPAPSGDWISYGPSFVPEVSPMRCGHYNHWKEHLNRFWKDGNSELGKFTYLRDPRAPALKPLAPIKPASITTPTPTTKPRIPFHTPFGF